MPVKFEVYRDGRRLSEYQPVCAMAIGPESVPVPGEVLFRDGLLVVSRADPSPTGVSLLWDAGSCGAYLLETTRLAPREKPYILNVELARMRLMKIVQKQEDWTLFDLPQAQPYELRLREAQSLLAEAISRQDEPRLAAALADDALARAIVLSEELSTFHSEILLAKRRSANAFARYIFGCRVDVGVRNQRYREMLASNFDHAVLPMPWKLIAPREGIIDTEEVDGWAESLSRRRIPVVAGPLINFDESELPDWLFIWENDFETLRDLAFEHVQTLVQRYRRAVSLWNVVSGISMNRAVTLSFEQMIDLTRLLVTQVKNALPGARTLVTVPMPFGEYNARNPTSMPPLHYAEMLSQSGTSLDGFAIELELGVPQPGMFLRDLFQISCLLDRFSTLGRPLFITALCVPGRWSPDPADRSEGRLDPSQAGRWRRPWDAQLQADWMEAVYHIALSKPFVETVAWGNLADIEHTVPGGGLLDDMYQPKTSFERLMKIRDKFAQWRR